MGALRFAPPQAPQAFEGVYDATSYGAACYNQVGKPPAIDSSLPFNVSSGTAPANESEDCMFLSWFARNIRSMSYQAYL